MPIGYEYIDFREVGMIENHRVFECGKCGAIAASTVTHQEFHDKLNKAFATIFNFFGMDIQMNEGHLIKTPEQLKETLPYINYF